MGGGRFGRTRLNPPPPTSHGPCVLKRALGLLVSVTVLAASWQDRDGAKTALLSVYLFTPIRFVFADQGFAGRLLDWAARTLSIVIDIVRKPPEQRGF